MDKPPQTKTERLKEIDKQIESIELQIIDLKGDSRAAEFNHQELERLTKTWEGLTRKRAEIVKE